MEHWYQLISLKETPMSSAGGDNYSYLTDRTSSVASSPTTRRLSANWMSDAELGGAIATALCCMIVIMVGVLTVSYVIRWIYRRRRHFKDYPCDTFTFAKQYDYELPSIGNGVISSSGLSATGSNPAHTSVSGADGCLNKDTLPVRWESPGVIASTPGQRLSRQLNSEFTGCHFGRNKSQNWALQNGTAAEEGRRHSNSFVVDVHPPTMSNHCVCHHIAAAVNGKTASTQSMFDDPRLVSVFNLSDEFCLKVVEDAFKGIVY